MLCVGRQVYLSLVHGFRVIWSSSPKIFFFGHVGYDGQVFFVVPVKRKDWCTCSAGAAVATLRAVQDTWKATQNYLESAGVLAPHTSACSTTWADGKFGPRLIRYPWLEINRDRLILLLLHWHSLDWKFWRKSQSNLAVSWVMELLNGI